MRRIFRNSKKGISLAYVMIAAMALLILSTTLVAAAGRNVTLTQTSVQGRQAYLTAKSAIEYAKEVVFQERNAADQHNSDREKNKIADEAAAKNTADQITKDDMHSFSVQPGTGSNTPYLINYTSVKPDGTNTLAECTVALNTTTVTRLYTYIKSELQADGHFLLTPTELKRVTVITVDGSTSTDTETSLGGATEADSDVPEEDKTPKLVSVQYIFKFHIKIEAKSAAGDAGSLKSLCYEADCTVGAGSGGAEIPPEQAQTKGDGSGIPENPGPEFMATGISYGDHAFLNSSGFMPGGKSDYPVVINSIVPGGDGTGLQAPEIYFMQSNLASATGDTAYTLITDFIYFNGNVTSVKDIRSHLICWAPPIGLQIVIYFNHTRLTCNDGSVKSLDGFYTLLSGQDLFNPSTILRKADSSDYPNYGKRISVLQANASDMVSADSRGGVGIGWLGDGKLESGHPSIANGKTVYMYISGGLQNWGNKLQGGDGGTPYGAKNIVVQWAAGSDWSVPSNKTVLFQANYFAVDMNGKSIHAENGGSHFKVRSVNGTDKVTMEFPKQTKVECFNSYKIDAGVYLVKSGTDLFSADAKTFFTTPSNNKGAVGSQFTRVDPSAAVHAPNYLLYGCKYGSSHDWVIQNWHNAPAFYGKPASSDYPVVFNLPVQSASGGQTRELTAPQLFFMGLTLPNTKSGDIRNSAIYTYNSGTATLKTNFIYIASDKIVYKGNEGDRSSLKLIPLNGTGYIYFAQDCTVYWSKNDNFNDGDEQKKSLHTFKRGCYAFSSESGTELFTSNPDLTKVDESQTQNILKDNYADYIEKYHLQLVSGETFDNVECDVPYNGSAGWEWNGIWQPSCFLPDKWPDEWQVTWLPQLDQSGKDVYLYFQDNLFFGRCTDWWWNTDAVYKANLVSLNYIGSSKFTVPPGKAVTFKVKQILLNGQLKDGNHEADADDKLDLTQGNKNTKFFLTSPSGSGTVTVVLPHALKVTRADGTGYTVPPGTYTVPSGTDLFAEGGGSGGTPVTINVPGISVPATGSAFSGGVYTDG